MSPSKINKSLEIRGRGNAAISAFVYRRTRFNYYTQRLENLFSEKPYRSPR